MNITFGMDYILLAIFTSVMGILLKPCLKREIKGFKLTKILPYALLLIGILMSFLAGDLNFANALIRGVVSTALAVLGYDGVKGLLCGRKNKVV